MPLLLLMIIHVLISAALVLLVFLQRGKGSEMGAAFGAGASGTMFGSQGTTPFMVKLIASLAVIFFCTSLGLNYMVSKTASTHQQDILDLEPGPVIPQAPTKNDNVLQQQSQKIPDQKM